MDSNVKNYWVKTEMQSVPGLHFPEVRSATATKSFSNAGLYADMGMEGEVFLIKPPACSFLNSIAAI